MTVCQIILCDIYQKGGYQVQPLDITKYRLLSVFMSIADRKCVTFHNKNNIYIWSTIQGRL